MKRYSLLLLAVSSLLMGTGQAATRPHYGGVLRVQVREAPAGFDPTSLSAARLESLSRLVYETLVRIDERGRPQPWLAESWQAEPGNQRWRFIVRGGVSFHDGSALDATAVVGTLRTTNPEWKVVASGNTVTIELDTPDPELAAELGQPRYAIFRRAGDRLVGTGLFSIAQGSAGKHLSLVASDTYWGGRPYVDGVEVELGRNDREQLTSFDLGKAEMVEVAPENIRRARADGRHVEESHPAELLAVVFTNAPQKEDATHVRNALALSLDTAAINSVVLQSGGEPTGALLPNWLSGYGFVFPTGANLERARQERAMAKTASPITLAYEASDPVARVIAERIQLNARDVNLVVQLTGTNNGNADARLARIPLASTNAHVALMEFAKILQLARPKFASDSVTELYDAEKLLLQSHKVIPLLHLRSGIAIGSRVRAASVHPDNTLGLDNAWIAAGAP
jgi:peptide/nickel transport system substrate-binding protein